MYFRSTAASVLAAVLLASCGSAEKEQRIDVCDLPKQAGSLLGEEIVVVGWYSGGYHDSLIAAAACKDMRLVPIFAPGTKASFADPDEKQQSYINGALHIGVWPQVDFYGHFRGVLRKEIDGVSAKGQPLSHYELEVDRIDAVRSGRAPFIDPPPSCDAKCRRKIDDMIRADQEAVGAKGNIAR